MDRFELSEFDCKCGHCSVRGDQMEQSTLDKLDAAAKYDQAENCYMPWLISSGMRCALQNAHPQTNGSSTSSHLKGYAADIIFSGSRQRYRIVSALLHAGFNRIGISETFIHVDDDADKSPEVIWLY